MDCHYKNNNNNVVCTQNYELQYHSEDDSLRLRLEFLHDVKKVVVDLWLATELRLHLVQVAESIFHLQALELRTVLLQLLH